MASRVIGLGGALAMLAGPVPAAAAEPVYVVDGVTGTIAADELLGVRRAGLLCLPAGPIRMRTLLPDGRLDQQEVVAQALEEAGLRYFRSSAQAAGRGLPRYRVHGTVRAAAFDLCDRRNGGTRAAYSGTARIEMLWRVQGYAGADRDFRLSTTVEHVVERAAAAPLGAIYRALLADAARQLAERLKRGPSAPP